MEKSPLIATSFEIKQTRYYSRHQTQAWLWGGRPRVKENPFSLTIVLKFHNGRGGRASPTRPTSAPRFVFRLLFCIWYNRKWFFFLKKRLHQENYLPLTRGQTQTIAFRASVFDNLFAPAASTLPACLRQLFSKRNQQKQNKLVMNEEILKGVLEDVEENLAGHRMDELQEQPIYLNQLDGTILAYSHSPYSKSIF